MRLQRSPPALIKEQRLVAIGPSPLIPRLRRVVVERLLFGEIRTTLQVLSPPLFERTSMLPVGPLPLGVCDHLLPIDNRQAAIEAPGARRRRHEGLVFVLFGFPDDLVADRRVRIVTAHGAGEATRAAALQGSDASPDGVSHASSSTEKSSRQRSSPAISCSSSTLASPRNGRSVRSSMGSSRPSIFIRKPPPGSARPPTSAARRRAPRLRRRRRWASRSGPDLHAIYRAARPTTVGEPPAASESDQRSHAA